MLVIARDITATRRQTDELRANQHRFNMIVNSLDLGFYTIDMGQRITAMIGRWAEEQFARSRVLIGKDAGDLLPREVAVLHEEANAKALAGEDVTFRWTVPPEEGEPERFIRTHLAPMRDADGGVIGAVGVWTDETDAVTLERERESLRGRVADAERIESLGNLVSGVAHELNNPLAAILNFTEDLLADSRPDDERIALEVIQAQALRSRTIVRDLLTFVRKGDRRPRKIEAPGPVLDTLIRALRPGFATQGVVFDTTISGEATPLLMDRAGFEQVVTNLLTNAAQAAGAGGAVRLFAQRDGDAYDVVVEDNGRRNQRSALREDFRAVLHHQANGAGSWPRPLRFTRHRAGARRISPRREPGRGSRWRRALHDAATRRDRRCPRHARRAHRPPDADGPHASDARVGEGAGGER